MPKPRTIEQRLDAIEIMLATICNKLSASPDTARSLKEFVAAGKAKGYSMPEILKQYNQHLQEVGQ